MISNRTGNLGNLVDKFHYLKDPEHPNKDYLSNHISTTKYTLLSFIPKNLFEQFHRQAGIKQNVHTV
jgi:hypothetical protein